MNNKQTIIISVVGALVLTTGVYFARDIILKPFHGNSSTKIDAPSNVNGQDFFNSLSDEKTLKDGELSYEAISKNYFSFKTLELSLSSNTQVFQDGKKVDESNDNQIFKYVRKDKLLVKGADEVLYCDGKNVTKYLPRIKSYVREPISNNFFTGLVTSSPGINTIGLLSGADYSSRIVKFEPMGKEKVLGKDCDVVKVTLKGGAGVKDFDQKLWIEPSKGIIVKNTYTIIRTMKDPGTGKDVVLQLKSSSTINSFKIDEKISDSDFKFVPAKDDKRYDPVEEQKKAEEQMKAMEKARAEAGIGGNKQSAMTEAQMMQKELDAKVINKKVYDFKALGFKPSDSLGKKLIVIFWKYDRNSAYLSDIDKFYRDNKDKYNIVTISIGDKTDNQVKEIAKKGYVFPIYYISEAEMKKTTENLLVFGVPTTYYIDQLGVVKWATLGFAPANILEKIAQDKLDNKIKPVGKDTATSDIKSMPNISVDPNSNLTNEIKPDINEDSKDTGVKQDPAVKPSDNVTPKGN